MGIELPRELADVAAQAGVTWPEADEERMHQAAQAWRDAGTKMSNLARDADGTARTALNAVEGQTGEAARQHWSTFVAPDTGHLTASARGCTAAADRLDHAANQVGAAKVEIVRNLVALAQNRDAAHQAANAGYPEALAGLDTAVRGTAANVANIQTSLVGAVQPATGVDIADVQNPVNANPGTHGPGPLEPVNTVVGEVTRDVADTGGQVIDDAGQAVDRTTQDVGSGAPSPIGSGGGAPIGGGGGAPGVPGVPVPLPGDGGAVPLPGDGVVPLPGDGGTGGQPGEPGVGIPAPPVEPLPPDGPVTIEPGPAPPIDGGLVTPGIVLPEPGFPGDLGEVPTPPTGTPGQVVQAGLAGPVLDAPAQGPAAAAPGAAGPGPGAGGAAPAPGGAGQGPGFVPPPGGGPVAGGPPPPGSAAPGGAPGGAGAGAAVPPPRPGDRGVMRFDAVAPAGEPPRGGKPGWTAAVPPGPPAAQSGTGAPGPAAKAERDQAVALFWVHMFPIGHMPVADDRPARQLTPPRVEVDYAAGLRFEPGDHPDSALVDGADRLAALREGAERIGHGDGLHSDDPQVSELLDGHDPLGGENERDWDRRYLVRLGSVTARGITRAGMEFAWPPAERYPEGGTAPGEPEILAEGTVIDRFGPVEGRIFAADRTAFAQRSLPPFQADSGYRRYEVLRPLPVWRAVSAAWFAQPGGGVRYRATHPAADLVALGYLADITEGTDE